MRVPGSDGRPISIERILQDGLVDLGQLPGLLTAGRGAAAVGGGGTVVAAARPSGL